MYFACECVCAFRWYSARRSPASVKLSDARPPPPYRAKLIFHHATAAAAGAAGKVSIFEGEFSLGILPGTFCFLLVSLQRKCNGRWRAFSFKVLQEKLAASLKEVHSQQLCQNPATRKNGLVLECMCVAPLPFSSRAKLLRRFSKQNPVYKLAVRIVLGCSHNIS